jgi:N,N-dimethylformamidase
LVRVIHGDANPDGPGVKLIHVPATFEGIYPGRRQPIDAGSCMARIHFRHPISPKG